jgi:signal transduction histidine kinase
VTRVRDYGIGIPSQDFDKVFQPFVRGTHAKKDGGFGLGLSLVSKVVHTMGGRIWAEAPCSGPGVVMCIELPNGGIDMRTVKDTEVRRAI